jgi:hypothetical protein
MAAATPATSFDEESVSSGTGSRSALRGLLPVQYNDPVAVGCPIMECTGKKPRRRRTFTPEFKAEIVAVPVRGPVEPSCREGLQPQADGLASGR